MRVKMTNFLITGCAGFIGSHAVDIFLANGHTVVGVDKLTYAGSIQILNLKKLILRILKDYMIATILLILLPRHM